MARQLVVELVADQKKFSRGLDEAEQSVGKFSGGMKKLGGTIGGLVAGAGLVSFLSDSVTEFNESAKAQAKLDVALRNSQATVGVTRDAFADFNKELAKHTLADDDVLAAGEAVLANFNLTEQQLKDTIPIVADVAATMGTDIPAASELVGKALLGNTRALKELGIEGFVPTGDRARDLATLQQLLADKTKGAAQAQLDAAGPSATFKKSLDELKETVGERLVPALNTAVGWLTNLMDAFTNMSPTGQAAVEAVAGVTLGVWALSSALEAAGTVAAVFGVELTIATGPIGIAIAAIAVLTAGLVLMYQRNSEFRDGLKSAWEDISYTFVTVVANMRLAWHEFSLGVMAIMQPLMRGWADVLDIFDHDSAMKLRQSADHFDQLKVEANDSINQIQKQIDVRAELHGFREANMGIEYFRDAVLSVPRVVATELQVRTAGVGAAVPGFASGGTAEGWAVVGERGPELAYFGRPTQIYPSGSGPGGATFNVVVNAGMGADGTQIGAQIVAELQQYERRNGTGWRS